MPNVGSPTTPGAGRFAHISDHAILKAFIDGHGNDPDHYLSTLLDVAVGVRNPGDVFTWLLSGLAGFQPATTAIQEVDASVNVSGTQDNASTVPVGGGDGAQVVVTKSFGAGSMVVNVPAVVPWGAAPAWPVYVDSVLTFQRDGAMAPTGASVYLLEATPSAQLAGAPGGAIVAQHYTDQFAVPTQLGSILRFARMSGPLRVDPAGLRIPRSWGVGYQVHGASAGAGAKIWTPNPTDVAPGATRSGSMLRALRYAIGS